MMATRSPRFTPSAASALDRRLAACCRSQNEYAAIAPDSDQYFAINNGDDAGITNAMQAVERALDRTLRAQGSLGADQRGLDEAGIRMTSLRRAAEVRRSGLEDANMAEAMTRLGQADTAYRASLAAVSTAERVSLLDYLR